MPNSSNLLVKNAHILTLDEHLPHASALCIQDGRIIFVGETRDAEKFSSMDMRELDLGGATVVPGLIDSHTHLAHTGLTVSSLDLVDATSIAEILSLVDQAVKDRSTSEVIFATRLDDSHLSDDRFPTRKELDSVAPHNPVLLRHRTGHSCVLNSAAIKMAQIPADTPGIQLDDEGLPNGVMQAQANGAGQVFFKGEIFQQQGIDNILRMAIAEALKAGITTVHALEDENIVERLLAMLPDLPIRVIIYPQTRDVDRALSFALGRFGGCGVSCLDGDIGSVMTAALLEPYACPPYQRGSLYFEDEELKSIVLDAHTRGMQVSMHAVGDRAVAQGLMAIEYAQERFPRPDTRHRIEHWELHNPQLSEKAIELGVWADIQPSFNYFWPHSTDQNERTLGKARLDLLDPAADLLTSGMQLAGGSDSPVTPLSPLLGIHSAVNHSNPRQRIQPSQALKLFTSQAAQIAFEEKDKGSLQVGMLGDLTVLSADPLSTDPSTIKDIAVLYTVVNGDIVYQQ